CLKRSLVVEYLADHQVRFLRRAEGQSPYCHPRISGSVEVDKPVVAGRFHRKSVQELCRDEVPGALSKVVLGIVACVACKEHETRRFLPTGFRVGQKILERLGAFFTIAEFIVEINYVSHRHRQSLTLPESLQRLDVVEEDPVRDYQ